MTVKSEFQKFSEVTKRLLSVQKGIQQARSRMEERAGRTT